jgi:hypothetical protein
MGADLEDFLVRRLAMGCPEGILMREGQLLRGVDLWRIPGKTDANAFFDGH